MRAAVTKIKDLGIVLKDLERYVKAPEFLREGRPFRNFGLRPREVLANWLICAAGNFENPGGRLTFATDPFDGDGVIVNQESWKCMFTEHVFIPRAITTTSKTVQELMISGIEHKKSKGHTYAIGRHLVVFSEAVGQWYPSRAARSIAGKHSFESVWVLHLESAGDSGYVYCVSLLDAAQLQAPVWKVLIDGDFRRWTVERIQ